jgi:hypothetical protein
VTTVRAAWDVPWFQIYGTTEVPTLGAHCSHHTGLHLFEDLAIVVVVDENDRPAPAGHTGHRLLVANLVVAPSEPCLCLRPFRLVPGIEGRNDDILYLPGAAGCRVAVHPLALRSPLTEVADLAQYQIRCTDARLIVRASLRSAAPADVLDSLATSMSNTVSCRLAACSRKKTTLGADADVDLPARDAPPRPLFGPPARRNAVLREPSHAGQAIRSHCPTNRPATNFSLYPRRTIGAMLSAGRLQGSPKCVVAQSFSRMNRTWAARPGPKTASNSQ